MKKEPEIIKLLVDSYDHRKALILSFAEAGFKVWIEYKQGQMGFDSFVCFEKQL